MGTLYQGGGGLPPPQKPSGGGNPLIWALAGGSVVMMVLAVAVAAVLLVRGTAPPSPATTQQASASAPAQIPPGEPSLPVEPAQVMPGQAQQATPYPDDPARPGSRSFRRPRVRRQRPGYAYSPQPGYRTASAGAYGQAVPAQPAPDPNFVPPQHGFGSSNYGRASVASGQPAVIPPPSAMRPSQPRPQYGGYGGGSPQDVIARVKGSVLLIITEGSDGIGSGTGFVVSGSQVATCAHVIEGARRIQLIAPDGRRYRASVGTANSLSDVAVLTVVGGSLPPPLSLGSYAQARDGDEIAVTGYPQTFSMLAEGYSPTPSTSRGTISAKRSQVVNGMAVPQLQTDAAVNPGNSGGPLYSLRDGTVYGLAASLLNGSPGMNFASSVDALRRLLGR